MKEFHYKSWSDFEKGLIAYHKLSVFTRRKYVFRGQASEDWGLQTTLQRFVSTFAPASSTRIQTSLREEFARASVGLHGLHHEFMHKEDYRELLARHHGLPSPILDWTRSPYVAAFFAFADPLLESDRSPERVAIWSFNLESLDAEPQDSSVLDEVDVIDDPAAIAMNPRAIEQESVFVRVDQEAMSMESLVPQALMKFTLPASEGIAVLTLLDTMRINRRSLFRDLDAAAQTATMRVSLAERYDG